MIKETENGSFEIVHPSSSQMMQEEDTGGKKQEDAGEKEHPTVPNEEDKMREQNRKHLHFLKKQTKNKNELDRSHFIRVKIIEFLHFFQLFNCNNVCLIGKSLL